MLTELVIGLSFMLKMSWYLFNCDYQFPVTCPPVEALSTISICYRHGEKLDNCNQENLILNTTVNYKCKYGYQQNEQPPEKQSSECILQNEKEAFWYPPIFECVPGE